MAQKGELVYVVGINDADYSVYRTEKIDGKRKVVWSCPLYKCWHHMMERGYSERLKSRFPTYKECKVVKEWHSFMNFRSWMEKQDWEGKELDKDILFAGNKIYGPETCVFITNTINKFLCGSDGSRGNLPIGVSARGVKFVTHIQNPFTSKREQLGCFMCPEVAHLEWKKRKNTLAHEWAKTQTDPRVIHALQTRYK